MVEIIMDNGNVYEFECSNLQLDKILYNTQRLQIGGEIKTLRNSFVELPLEENILINPSHISSIKVK